MMSSVHPSHVAVLALATFITSAASTVGDVHVSLLPDVSVHGDLILLLDLLPGAAPPAVRARAKDVSLGPAPQWGASRELQRSFVARAITGAGLDDSLFLIPPAIVVHRSERFIRSEEVFNAVEAFLKKSQINPSHFLSSLKLTFDPSIRVPLGDLRLEVAGAEKDMVLQLVRFRLVSRAQPGMVPFYAALPISHSTPFSAFSAVSASFSAGRPPASPPLVDPRRSARLRLRSSNSELSLEVKPLQTGRLDETIRVRLPSTGRTFRAKVIAADTLEAAY